MSLFTVLKASFMILAALIVLNGCADSSRDEYAHVEGIVQVSMMPLRGNDDRLVLRSQIDMITDTAILLLLIDQDTKFIDPDVDEGILQLGDMYRAETVSFSFPNSSTYRVAAEVDSVRIVKRLERIGPAGPDAPTRDKVRRLKAFQMTPQVQALAEKVDAIIMEQLATSPGYTSPNLEFIHHESPAICGEGQGTKYLGTFYCAQSQTVFVDRDWMVALESGVGMYVAYDMEYMLAHAYAHHIQHHAGAYLEKPSKTELTPKLINELIDFELQADCIAGAVLANMKFSNVFEIGDVTEAMATVSNVGGDTYQKTAGSVQVTDSLTHGTRDQRFQAIAKGIRSADTGGCT